VLPHVLEFSENPHQILREVARVLLPEAQVAIACFNPWSLWGFRRTFGRKRRYPWNGRFINLPRLKDWCALLSLEITAGQMSCYVPPCSTEKWLKRFAFMDAAGDRWWPVAGSVYFLQAVKRVRGMRLILPRWSDRLAPNKALSPAPKKVRQPEDAVVARNGMTHEP
jgi:SAM-dependent methyltransferase